MIGEPRPLRTHERQAIAMDAKLDALQAVEDLEEDLRKKQAHDEQSVSGQSISFDGQNPLYMALAEFKNYADLSRNVLDMLLMMGFTQEQVKAYFSEKNSDSQ
jgi:hypothetical protein